MSCCRAGALPICRGALLPAGCPGAAPLELLPPAHGERPLAIERLRQCGWLQPALRKIAEAGMRRRGE